MNDELEVKNTIRLTMPDGSPRDAGMHLFRNSESESWVPRYLLARVGNYSTDSGGILNGREFICTDESGKCSYAYRYCVPHPNTWIIPELFAGVYHEPTLMNIPPLKAAGKLWKTYLTYNRVMLEEIVEVKEPDTFIKVDVPSVTVSAAKPLPRLVEAYQSGSWGLAVLVADASSLGISNPYVIINAVTGNGYATRSVENIRELGSDRLSTDPPRKVYAPPWRGVGDDVVWKSATLVGVITPGEKYAVVFDDAPERIKYAHSITDTEPESKYVTMMVRNFEPTAYIREVIRSRDEAGKPIYIDRTGEKWLYAVTTESVAITNDEVMNLGALFTDGGGTYWAKAEMVIGKPRFDILYCLPEEFNPAKPESSPWKILYKEDNA